MAVVTYVILKWEPIGYWEKVLTFNQDNLKWAKSDIKKLSKADPESTFKLVKRTEEPVSVD